MDGILSTGELARVLRILPHRLQNIIDMGKVSPPKLLGRYAWGRAEAAEAARILGVTEPAILNQVRNLPELPASAARG